MRLRIISARLSVLASAGTRAACNVGPICKILMTDMGIRRQNRRRLLSTKRPENMDGASGSSTPEPLSMDECRKNPVLSTKMAVFVDGEAWLSTIRAVYVDKWQKNRHPSTYKPDFVDGATGPSMKTALSVDDSGPKDGMICLQEVDTLVDRMRPAMLT